MDFKSIKNLQAELAGYGLLLCEVKAVDQLPDNIWLGKPHYQSGSILLVGNAGAGFWSELTKDGLQGDDPVDQFSVKVTEQALAKHLPDVSRECLFPEAVCELNLLALGRAFAWHTRSPLGMGIHADYGLWSAFRAAWWLGVSIDRNVDAPVSDALVTGTTDVCSGCQSQACISHCPAEALSMSSSPRLNRCADYRLSDQSQCTSTCIARVACPYAAEHRYSKEQITYHYELALSAIADYRHVSD